MRGTGGTHFNWELTEVQSRPSEAWTGHPNSSGQKKPFYFTTPNVSVVVECIVWPGFKVVVGKSGWFGESG